MEGITEAENKLCVIFNTVNQCMRSRRLKPNSDKREYILVTANNSMHTNVDMNPVMLGNIPVQLSNSVRNLRFVIGNQLNLDEQINKIARLFKIRPKLRMIQF